MKKRRIVIASVLKPVDDTRMFEKMGMTLWGSGKYEVFIIGQASKVVPTAGNINFIGLKVFRRISFARLLAPFRIHGIISKVSPEVLIVNTHELLIVALLNRIIFGTRIVYDVRENYFRNILYTDAFPVFLRPVLAGWVRLMERMCSPWIHRFFLAERGYQQEMTFFGGRSIIIENKAAITGNLHREPDAGKTRLLFSGTLAESTGVFGAISLAKELHKADPAIKLTVIGSCARLEILEKIRTEIDRESYITLIGGDALVPHAEIMKAIYAADFGIVYYPPSRHTENSIPTKLYEYLAARLPMLLQPRQSWIDLCAYSHACIPVDFSLPDAGAILAQMRSRFYVNPPVDILWETEGQKLLAALEII